MAYGFHVHPKEYTADVRGFSFVVERDGDLYKAYKSGKGLTFEDDDASEVMQLSINKLITENGGYGKILLKLKDAEIKNTIYVKPVDGITPRRIVIEGLGSGATTLLARNNLSTPVFHIQDAYRVAIKGLTINGGFFDGYADPEALIKIESVSGLTYHNRIEDIGLTNFGQYGIHLKKSDHSFIFDVIADSRRVLEDEADPRSIIIYIQGCKEPIVDNIILETGNKLLRIANVERGEFSNLNLDGGLKPDGTYAGTNCALNVVNTKNSNFSNIMTQYSEYCNIFIEGGCENLNFNNIYSYKAGVHGIYISAHNGDIKKLNFTNVYSLGNGGRGLYGDALNGYTIQAIKICNITCLENAYAQSIRFYADDTPSYIYDVIINSGWVDKTIDTVNVASGEVVVKNVKGYPTENSGVATFSGDGSTTEFKIEHGLVSTPSKYGVSPLTPDAHADKTISVDDTYIIITFSTAPPSGTDNLKFGWWAEV